MVVKVPQFCCVPSTHSSTFISRASDTKPHLLIDCYVNAFHLWVQVLLVIPHVGQEHLNQIWVSVPSQLQKPIQLLKHEHVMDLIKFLLLKPLKTQHFGSNDDLSAIQLVIFFNALLVSNKPPIKLIGFVVVTVWSSIFNHSSFGSFSWVGGRSHFWWKSIARELSFSHRTNRTRQWGNVRVNACPTLYLMGNNSKKNNTLIDNSKTQNNFCSLLRFHRQSVLHSWLYLAVEILQK